MDKEKKILHISTFQRQGGAALAALRLSNAQRRLGYDSSLLTRQFGDLDNHDGVFRPAVTLPYRIGRFLRRRRIQKDFEPYRDLRSPGMELFSDDRSEFGSSLPRQLPACDIVNLHWVCGLVDVRSFFRYWKKPVVWTLHDMNPFTGGCHYDLGCGRYLDRCGCCPQLLSAQEHDLSRDIWDRKKKAYDNLAVDRLHIVAPSGWMASLASNSPLLRRFPVSVIANGIDTDIFRPRDSADVRKSLEIPDGTPVLLFIADYPANQRKGFALLADAIHKLSGARNFCLISIGGDRPRLPEHTFHIHLDSISDEDALAVIYSLADVFVIPSIEDNLPNTTIESIACGTPVVGFRVGGIQDVVREGLTGILVEPGNTEALRGAIRALLEDHDNRRRMAHSCREVAMAEYAQEKQAARYLELYEQTLRNL